MTTIFIGCDNSKSEIELLMESMAQKALLADAGMAEYMKLNKELQVMIQNQTNNPTDTQEEFEKYMGEMKIYNEKLQKFKVCMDGLNAEINTDTEKLDKFMEEKTIDDVSKKEMMKAAMALASGLTENISFEEYCNK